MTVLSINLLLSALLFILGLRCGLIILRYGITARDLFKGQTPVSLLFLGLYVFFMVMILNVPQWPIFPLEWRIYGLHITWTVMRVCLLGVCGVAIALSWHTARTQVCAITLIGIVGFCSFWGVESYWLSPIYPSLVQDIRPDGIVKQTSNSSCAPAALATVLNQWNLATSEPEVAKLARTSRMGTSMPQLVFAAQQLGMAGLELRPSWETIQRINRPGILSIWLVDGDRRLPHAVALLGLDQTIAVIADPAEGNVFQVDRDTLEAVWRRDYVPIFRPEDAILSKQDALRYLTAAGYTDNSPHPFQWWPLKQHTQDNPLEERLENRLHQFQAHHVGLKRSGQLDTATILALRGAFSDDGPILSPAPEQLTLRDYHHVDS